MQSFDSMNRWNCRLRTDISENPPTAVAKSDWCRARAQKMTLNFDVGSCSEVEHAATLPPATSSTIALIPVGLLFRPPPASPARARDYTVRRRRLPAGFFFTASTCVNSGGRLYFMGVTRRHTILQPKVRCPLLTLLLPFSLLPLLTLRPDRKRHPTVVVRSKSKVNSI